MTKRKVAAKLISCADCGAAIASPGKWRKLCHDCVSAARIRGLGSVPCIDCGAVFRRRGGRQVRCTDCQASYAVRRRREYRVVNRSRLREARAQHYRKNRDRELANNARWAADNTERLREYKALLDSENEGRRKGRQARERELDSAINATRNGEKWTPAEDALVLSWAYGLRELGAALGRTRRAVGARRQLLRKQDTIN